MKILYKFFVLSVLFILSTQQVAHAQARCGFDENHKKLMETDAAYRQSVENFTQDAKRYAERNPNMVGRVGATSYIPVVVHIMHTGGAVGTIYNPTDAVINATITYINQVFAGTAAGMTAAGTNNAAGNMELQFVLAQRTPSCGYTNGIDRVNCSSYTSYVSNGVNNSGSSGISDVALKDISRWDVTKYYNIWVVNKIDGADGTSGQFVAGYAYFAGASATVDGTVMLATQFVSGEKTLPHELGHAFNLYHPFEGSSNSSQCPANTTCATQGDQVCDTDPISNNNVGGVYDFSCRTGANSCNSGLNHNPNTENNFMSYTTCFTLFTAGQKTRVQAAVAGSRAVLAASNAGTPCGTVINFAAGTAAVTEATATTSGCRYYTDYTYSMTIGSAPSAAAIATLTLGGTATQGLDYDITTNGSFTSPSLALSFASGATAAQNFTLRVYNDASVETNETINLGFTLNNGGGNASVGTTFSTMVITLTSNDIAPAASSTGTSSTIGSYTTNLSNTSCFKSNAKHKTQYLVTAAELAAAGITVNTNLTSLVFTVQTKNSTIPFTGLTVSLGHTTTTSFGNFDGSASTQVYTGNYSTTSGNNTITFTTPFTYNGSSNLLLTLCYDNGSTTTITDVMQGNQVDGTNYYTVLSNYSSGVATGCALPAASISTFRPKLNFGYSITGTVVENATVATKSEQLVVGSDDYFYSSNNKLMARISGINASLGCTGVQVEAAGNTWVSFGPGMRSAKVFNINPTTNASTAGYTVSLYFDNAELGGVSTANLRLAKSSAASIATMTTANTVVVTPTVTSLGSNTVVTSSFTGFSRFFLVDNNVPLPLQNIIFSGRNINGYAALNWQTQGEVNNLGFDIEKSQDGISYTRIGFVPSTGLSTGTYSFSDLQPLSLRTYYRLKQIDRNNNFTYSKVVILNAGLSKQEILFVTNPAKEQVQVQLQKNVSKQLQLQIFTVNGQMVQTQNFGAGLNLYSLPLNGKLAAGLYLLKIIADDEVFVKKLTIQ
jgi:hypothetical protein